METIWTEHAPTYECDPAVPNGRAEPNLRDHLVVFPGGQWSLWRTACLRGAGFPAADVLRLSTPDCAAGADQVLTAEEAVATARAQAQAEVNLRLDALRCNGEWEQAEKRVPLVSALQSLKAGKLPAHLAGEDVVNEYLDRYRAASQLLQEAQARFRTAYLAGVEGVSQAIRELLLDSRFCEAMIWQNRHVHHLVKRTLLRGAADAGGRSSKQRQSEELIASYLQRYCVKNDSIGFFGPIGWADLHTTGDATLTAAPGPALMAERHVYFEGWCIDALAEKLTTGEMRRWAAPRPLPYIRLEGNAIHLPLSTRPVMLSSRQAAVLRACYQRRAAVEIAAQLLRDTTIGIANEEGIYRTLELLQQRGLINWSFEVPLAPHPERELRRQLERIEPSEARTEALRALAEMEDGRRAVARAAGDPQKLDEALVTLEETFTRLTATPATRAEGQTYAARTLVYEDGRRDIDVAIGPELLRELGAPLSLMLTSARWLSARIAERYVQAFHEAYRELSRRINSPTVEAVDFWLTVQPLLYDEKISRPVDHPTAQFEERWAHVLELPREGRRLEYDSAALGPRVRAVFEAPGPGWRQARYHSPDVMLAAESVAAIQRGDYQFVLGEMHLASNTLGAALFVAQHPAPEDLHRYVANDLADVKLHFVIPKSWPNQTQRTIQMLIPPNVLRVEAMHDAICPEGYASLAVKELVVEELQGELMLRTRDGRLRFSILDALGDALSRLVINAMNILARSAHTPRVTIDRMVVCRECWRPAAGDLQFAYLKDEAERFLAARRWARALGIPRFIFVKAPVEVKPVFVDFGSTVYVDLFAKLIRRTVEGDSPATQVSLSEMLPQVAQSWLPDSRDRKYTSEFRLVARDLSGDVAVDLDHLDRRSCSG
jgi:hypothetical protein